MEYLTVSPKCTGRRDYDLTGRGFCLQFLSRRQRLPCGFSLLNSPKNYSFLGRIVQRHWWGKYSIEETFNFLSHFRRLPLLDLQLAPLKHSWSIHSKLWKCSCRPTSQSEGLIKLNHPVKPSRLITYVDFRAKEAPGTWQVTREILAKDGFRGFNRGLGATIGRHNVWNAIYFGFYHSVKDKLPQYQVRWWERTLNTCSATNTLTILGPSKRISAQIRHRIS